MGTSRSSAVPAPILPIAAAVVPVLCGPWFRDAFGMPKLAAAAAASAAGLALLLREGRLLRLRSRGDAALAAFAAVVFLSAALSLEPRLSLIGGRLQPLFSAAGLCGCVAAFYLGVAEAAAGDDRLISAAVAGMLPVSLLAVLEAAGLQPLALGFGPLAWRPALIGGRAGATFGAPVALGFYLAIVLPLALHAVLDRRRSRAWRVVAGFSLVLGGSALALTGSRGACLGAAAACAVLFWPRAGRRLRWAALAALAAAGALALKARPPRTWAASDALRARAWHAAWTGWRSHPWLGSGVGTFGVDFARSTVPGEPGASREYPDSAHDDALEALATTGLAGLAAYAWLNVSAAGGALAAAGCDETGGGAALGASLLAAALTAKFNPPPLAAAWLASAFAGRLLAVPASEHPRAVGPGAFAILAAGAFAWTAWGWVRADRADLLGRLARAEGRPREAAVRFEGALALRPSEPKYVKDLCDLLWDVAGAAPAGARGPLVERAAAAAEAALRLRPRDAQLYRLLAQAEMRRRELAGEDSLEQAGLALAAAERLDPGFVELPSLKDRLRQLSGTPASGG